MMLHANFQLGYGSFYLNAELQVPAVGVTAIFGPIDAILPDTIATAATQRVE